MESQNLQSQSRSLLHCHKLCVFKHSRGIKRFPFLHIDEISEAFIKYNTVSADVERLFRSGGDILRSKEVSPTAAHIGTLMSRGNLNLLSLSKRSTRVEKVEEVEEGYVRVCSNIYKLVVIARKCSKWLFTHLHIDVHRSLTESGSR